MRVKQYSETSLPYERFGNNNNVINNNYDEQGTVESKQLIQLVVNRKLKEKLDIYVQYSFVDWDNAGFDPRNPLPYQVLPNIVKHSLGFGIQYRY